MQQGARTAESFGRGTGPVAKASAIIMMVLGLAVIVGGAIIPTLDGFADRVVQKYLALGVAGFGLFLLALGGWALWWAFHFGIGGPGEHKTNALMMGSKGQLGATGIRATYTLSDRGVVAATGSAPASLVPWSSIVRFYGATSCADERRECGDPRFVLEDGTVYSLPKGASDGPVRNAIEIGLFKVLRREIAELLAKGDSVVFDDVALTANGIERRGTRIRFDEITSISIEPGSVARFGLRGLTAEENPLFLAVRASKRLVCWPLHRLPNRLIVLEQVLSRTPAGTPLYIASSQRGKGLVTSSLPWDEFASLVEIRGKYTQQMPPDEPMTQLVGNLFGIGFGAFIAIWGILILFNPSFAGDPYSSAGASGRSHLGREVLIFLFENFGTTGIAAALICIGLGFATACVVGILRGR